MLTQIHHITIHVRSIAVALRRYTAFGLVCLRHTSLEAWLSAPNCLILLRVPERPIRNDRTIFDSGFSHCCMQTPSISHFFDKIAETDVRPRSQPVDLGTGHRYAYLDDDDAIVTECEGVPYAPPEQTAWLAHVAIATANLERLGAFYGELTGGSIRTSALIADNPGIDTIAQHSGIRAQAAWIRGLNLTIELWQFHSPQTTRQPLQDREMVGYASMSFVCDDLQSAQDHLVQCGATMEPLDPSGTRWFDPDGNGIELITTATVAALGLGTRSEPGIIARIESLWRAT